MIRKGEKISLFIIIKHFYILILITVNYLRLWKTNVSRNNQNIQSQLVIWLNQYIWFYLSAFYMIKTIEYSIL